MSHNAFPSRPLLYRGALAAMLALPLAGMAEEAAPLDLSLGKTLAKEFAAGSTPATTASPAPSPIESINSKPCDDAAGVCATKGVLRTFRLVQGVPLSERLRSTRCAGINTPDDCQRRR